MEVAVALICMAVVLASVETAVQYRRKYRAAVERSTLAYRETARLARAADLLADGVRWAAERLPEDDARRLHDHIRGVDAGLRAEAEQ